MKRYARILLLLWALAFSDQGVAQIRFNAGVHSGFAFNRIPGFSNDGPWKTGFNGGIILRATGEWDNSLQVEINFIQKGGYHKPDSIIPYYGWIDVNYIEIPVLYHCDFLDADMCGGGIEFGLAYARIYQKYVVFDYSYWLERTEIVRDYDISILGGASLSLGKHFSLRARAEYSLHPVLYRKEIPWQNNKIIPGRGHNLNLQLSLVFMIRRISS